MSVTTPAATEVLQTLEIIKHETIAAPADVVFETILEQIGPFNETPDGKAMPMKIEAWPGGRWMRDLGNNTGHFWAHVQAIKPPTLLELSGPLFMSCPAANNLQYRLSEENGVTRVKFTHRSIGWILEEYLQEPGVDSGWTHLLKKIRTIAENKQSR